jgi:hypothetical protein
LTPGSNCSPGSSHCVATSTYDRGMTNCAVLRCSSPAEHVFPVNADGAPLLEAVVCGQHHDQLESGAAWNWNYDHGEILMGSDATPRVADWGTEEGAGSSEIGVGLTLRFDLTQSGDVLDIVRIWMSKGQVEELSEWLSQIVPPQS